MDRNKDLRHYFVHLLLIIHQVGKIEKGATALVFELFLKERIFIKFVIITE